MKRRELILSTIAIGSGLAGCTSTEDDMPQMTSTTSLSNSVCDKLNNQAEINKQSENVMTINGTIGYVDEGLVLDSSLYGPSEEQSIICRIYTGEPKNEENTVACSGGVEYTTEIRYENMELSELIVLHDTEKESLVVSTFDL